MRVTGGPPPVSAAGHARVGYSGKRISHRKRDNVYRRDSLLLYRWLSGQLLPIEEVDVQFFDAVVAGRSASLDGGVS